MNEGIKIALRLDGMSEELIDKIEAALPACQRLVAAIEKLEPELKDLASVTPVIKELLAFLNNQGT